MIPQQQQLARVGDYVIESQIGSGGMGLIYKAKQISMHRIVALKVLRDNLVSNQKYLDRFFREVRLLASMEHPNMVRVYEGGNDRGNVWFSMEYIQGDDLNLYLMRRTFKFSEYQARFIGRHVALALAYAWNYQRMIHRDVKPANIMLTKSGEIKLLDLGISKKLDDDPNAMGHTTADGLLVGSPTYMSPEQVSAGKDIDFRTDIYSLGITLYHILAGKPPYDGTSVVDVITQHFSAPIPDIREVRPDISRRFANIIKKMMAKQKEDRFASWEDFIAALDKCEAMEKKRNQRKWSKLPLKQILLAVAVCFVTIPALCLLIPGETEEENTPVVEQTETAMVLSEVPTVSPQQQYNNLKKQYLDNLDQLLSEKNFEDGIRTCKNLPPQILPGGELEEFYKADENFKFKLDNYLMQFEELRKADEKILH